MVTGEKIDFCSIFRPIDDYTELIDAHSCPCEGKNNRMSVSKFACNLSLSKFCKQSDFRKSCKIFFWKNTLELEALSDRL